MKANLSKLYFGLKCWKSQLLIHFYFKQVAYTDWGTTYTLISTVIVDGNSLTIPEE